jgi:hypothetical protein
MSTPDEVVLEAERIPLRDWLAWSGRRFVAAMGAPCVLVSLVSLSLGLGIGSGAVAYHHEALLAWARDHNFAAPIPTAASVTYVDRSAAVLDRVGVLATTEASQTKQLDQISRQIDALLGKIEAARSDVAELRRVTSDENLKLPERVGVVTRAALQSVIVVKREPIKPAVKASAP